MCMKYLEHLPHGSVCGAKEMKRLESRKEKKSVKTVRKDRAEQISMLFQDEEQSHLIVFIHFLSTFHGGL